MKLPPIGLNVSARAWANNQLEGVLSMKRNIQSVLLIALFSAGLIGCEQEGPAEKAGAKVDEAMETAGEKLEEAGEAIEEKAGQ
ncbi:MAG: hypothetical protein PVF93_06775 [Chromatiaceae bacterium]